MKPGYPRSFFSARFALVGGLLTAGLAPIAAAAPRSSPWLLRGMTNLADVAEFPAPAYTRKQFSYMRALLLSCWCWLLTLAFTGCATHSSTPHASTPRQIYDVRADGERQVSQALAQAHKRGKYVLLDLGANWCSDSQAMFRLLENDPAIRDELQRHFVLVMVDVNQREGQNRNSQLVERYGHPLDRGIPVLLILAPNGALLNQDPAERLGDDAHKDPGKVLAYLLKWAPPPNK